MMLLDRCLPKLSIEAWLNSETRRAENEAALSADQAGWLFSAASLALLLVVRTVLRERQYMVALAGSSHCLVAIALAALIAHRRWGRPFYVRWREVLGTIAFLHSQANARFLTLRGAGNLASHHGGSAARLAVVLLVDHTVVWVALYSLYGRMRLPTATLSLAASALSSLASSERVCRHSLAAPGVAAPLASLHTFLSLLHGGATPHAFAHMLVSAAADPLQQCVAVSAWFIVAVGGVLPCLLLRRLERRRGGGSDSSTGAARQQEQQEQQQGQLLCVPTSVHRALPLYLASCVLWQLANLVPTSSHA